MVTVIVPSGFCSYLRIAPSSVRTVFERSSFHVPANALRFAKEALLRIHTGCFGSDASVAATDRFAEKGWLPVVVLELFASCNPPQATLT